MSEDLHIIPDSGKQEKYEQLLPQIRSLISGESNQTANLANISAALNDAFNFWWTGFYLVQGDELVLGPFQGPVACTRIPKGKGVCGAAWTEEKTVLVPDVHKFPGHIACSSATNSEIVVPVFSPDGNVWGVLDIDSEHLNHFDEVDQQYLELLSQMITEYLNKWS